MNLAYFISNRISKESEGTFSTIINRIAVVSIGLGLAILLIAFMILYGFKAEIKNKIYSFSGHLIVNKYTLSTSFDETINISDTLVENLRSYELTERFQPYAMKAGLLKTADEVQGVIIKGVDANFDTIDFRNHLVAGRFPDLGGENYSTEIAISRKISNYLELEIGGDVLVYFVQNPPRYRKLKVVGIYETGLEEFDEKIVMGDLNMLRRINNWDNRQAGGIEIFVKDLNQLERAEQELFNLLDVDLYVDKVTDKYVQIFDWLNLLNRNVVVLLTIILFVAGTSIISILLILIMERTQMIGMLKSIGASNGLIRRIFIWNGIRLVIKGLIWGNFLGLGVGAIQFYFKLIPLDAANYYMSHVPIQFDFLTILWLNLLVLVMISLTLYIPVTMVSRVQPVRAIRFD